MNFEFDGLDELINEVERIEGLSDDLKDKALIEGGDFLKDKIKSEVYSHGLTRRTGEAQEAITRTNPKNHELFVGTKGGAKQPGYYLYMQEFGFWNVVAQRFIAPKPTFSTVYENNKDGIMNKYADVFREGYGMK